MKNRAKTDKFPDLESSLGEISKLIETMEKGDLPLEDSLNKFERGIQLIKHCQNVLQEAEQKVQILIQKNNKEELKDYENMEE